MDTLHPLNKRLTSCKCTVRSHRHDTDVIPTRYRTPLLAGQRTSLIPARQWVTLKSESFDCLARGFAPISDTHYLTPMTDKPKRPRDANQLAKFIVDQSTMDKEELEAHRKKLAQQNQKPGNFGSSNGNGSDDT